MIGSAQTEKEEIVMEKTMVAQPVPSDGPLSAEELRKIDAYTVSNTLSNVSEFKERTYVRNMFRFFSS